MYCAACARESGTANWRGRILARASELTRVCYAGRHARSHDSGLVFPHERYGGIGDRSRIAVTELQDRHQATRQFRLALARVQHAKRRIQFDISPCFRKGCAQNVGFGGIENASLQFERTHRLRGGSLTTHALPNDNFCRRSSGGYQETLSPVTPDPPAVDSILS